MLALSNQWLLERKHSVITELVEVLSSATSEVKKSVFPRADYKECVENTPTLLGQDPPQGRHNRKPGATHSARWMGQMLYAQKMFMWSYQMNYNATTALFINFTVLKYLLLCFIRQPG